jgi:hypothetical protein
VASRRANPEELFCQLLKIMAFMSSSQRPVKHPPSIEWPSLERAAAEVGGGGGSTHGAVVTFAKQR